MLLLLGGWSGRACGELLPQLPGPLGQSAMGMISPSLFFISMPSEILLKILSYLDAVSLLCIGCVNKRFYHLANDNMIWLKIYSFFLPKRTNWKAKSVDEAAVSMNLTTLQDRESGYWKKEYIVKQITTGKTGITQLLKPINAYTGLPLKTKEAIKASGLGWVIVLKDRNGKEYAMEQVEILFNDTSVTLFWYGTSWPCLTSLSALELFGVTPLFFDRGKAATNKNWIWLIRGTTPLWKFQRDCFQSR
uniref:F-box protein 15 n=1 Tax=Sphenodon punctatus TaxID=8508 RepID=A0A8D0G2N8_SPHPU